MMKKLASKLLRATERLYLYAHGWRSQGDDKFTPPDDYPFERKPEYVRPHAVNAQRQVYAKKTLEERFKKVISGQ